MDITGRSRGKFPPQRWLNAFFLLGIVRFVQSVEAGPKKEAPPAVSAPQIQTASVTDSFSSTNTEPLYTRAFKVNVEKFKQALADKQCASNDGKSSVAFNLPRVIGDFPDQKRLPTSAPLLPPSRVSGACGAAHSPGPLNREGSGIYFVTKTNQTASLNDRARKFFELAGIKLEPPRSLFFNDRTGMLLVRTTLKDLEIIEKRMQAIEEPAPVK